MEEKTIQDCFNVVHPVTNKRILSLYEKHSPQYFVVFFSL
jgi:hypothetical protein